MTILVNRTRLAAMIATLTALSAVAAQAQVTTAPAYTVPTTTPTATGYAQHPMHSAAQPAYGQPAYGQATQGFVAQTQPVTQPAYGQPVYQQPAYGQPVYAAPRVADASQTAAAMANQVQQAVPAVQASHAVPPTPMAGAHPVAAGDCGCDQTSASWQSYAGAPTGCGPASCGTTACGTTTCGAGVASSCGNGVSCGTGIGGLGVGGLGGIDLGLGRRNCNRQWFGGIYYLLLDRVYGDRNQVGFISNTTTTDYYYQPTDTGFFTDDADIGVLHGAEIRFGSTFGPTDPCTCEPRFAWELAYWALNDGESRSLLVLDAPIASGNLDRIYGTVDYSGLLYDYDTTDGNPARPLNDYNDYGVPTDFTNDIRLTALRVRRRFQAQNLELNFWRFGSPECSSACGAGGCGSSCGGAACGSACGAGACGVGGCGDSCGSSCGGSVSHLGLLRSSRAPRRFFINGLLGVRYFRFDDDLGIDMQFTRVDGGGDPLAGPPAERDSYSGSFPLDDSRNVVHDIETDNELVGLQLGCSMNWLIGCRWNLFADSNFGIYGNNIETYQRVVGGGGGELTYGVGGGDVVSRSSETAVSFLGELRAGVAYQVTCNCRLSAAYRFIGMGGVSLADSQIPDAGFVNPGVVGYVDTDDSLILHGLQLGAEYQF